MFDSGNKIFSMVKTQFIEAAFIKTSIDRIVCLTLKA
jgi:hypothetical protein